MIDPNIFKEKLFNHTLPVKEDLWESIASKLAPEKDDRRLPIFWLILFTSAILGGAMMFGWVHPSNEIKPASEIPSITSTLTPKPQSAQEKPDITASSTSTPNQQTSSLNENSNSSDDISHSKQLSVRNTHSIQTENISTTNTTDVNDGYSTSTALPAKEKDENRSAINTRVTSFLPPSTVGTHTSEKPENEIASLKPDPNCYKFGGSGGTYALSADFFAGPGFSPGSFEDTGNENTIYAEAREATESNQYAWSAGARINLHLRNGLAARLGVMYEQTGDIFDYTDTLATQHSIRIDSFFAADGTFLYVDSSSVLIFGTLIKKIHNTYKRWDIPLLVGYELPLGRSTLMINAGPVFNLVSSHEGQILDPMLHPQYITPGAPNELHVYKTSLGMSLYLGAGALFPLSDNFSALVEPRFLYRIKPVTLDSYELVEHRHNFCLNLGIRYHIN